MKKIPQDIVGTIAILKFRHYTPWLLKKYRAWQFLKKHKNVTTVREKTGKFSGEMRIPKTRYLAGEHTSITTYKENNTTFTFDVDKTYFSPRLAHERKIVAAEVTKHAKQNAHILVCFAGVAPYPLAIAQELKKQKKKATIIANEINPDACRFAIENVRRNKLQDYITVVNDDIRNLPRDHTKKFDIIVMTRPNLEETFLKTALLMSKQGTHIWYHGFGTKDTVISEIRRDTKGKIGKITIRPAGDIGKGIYRYQARFTVT